jgi:uncharacterized iron-regulated membrane protein
MTTLLEGPSEVAAPAEVDDRPDESVPTRTSRGRIYRWLSKNRRPFFVVHKWASILLLLWVLMECVTGSILVFRPEIERFANRSDLQVTEGEHIGPGAAADAALADREGSVFDNVSLPDGDEAGGMYVVGLYDAEGLYHRALVDPGSGEVTNDDFKVPWFVQELADLHFELNSSSVFGLTGIEAQAWLGVAFLVIMLSGFYVWYWPRMRAWSNLFKIRRNRGRYRWHLDLHNVVGLVTLVPLLIITITGIAFGYPSQVAKVYDVVTLGSYDTEVVEEAAVSEPNGDEPIGLDRALVIAEDIGVVDVQFLGGTGGSPVGVYDVGGYIDSSAIGMLGGERFVDIHIDQYTGEILEVHDPADDSGVQRAMDEWSADLHFGTFGGIGIQLLWFLVGLGPAVLVITGVVMWINRHNVRKGRSAVAEADGGGA